MKCRLRIVSDARAVRFVPPLPRPQSQHDRQQRL